MLRAVAGNPSRNYFPAVSQEKPQPVDVLEIDPFDFFLAESAGPRLERTPELLLAFTVFFIPGNHDLYYRDKRDILLYRIRQRR